MIVPRTKWEIGDLRVTTIMKLLLSDSLFDASDSTLSFGCGAVWNLNVKNYSNFLILWYFILVRTLNMRSALFTKCSVHNTALTIGTML